MNAQTAPSSIAPKVPAPMVAFPRREAKPLNLTVFLAENDPGSRSALSAALDSLGCTTIGFSTGIEAIESAAEEIPDALLIDARLPDTDALQALSELKSDPSTRAIPVVIIATSLHHDEQAACMENGAQAFLTKPVNIDALFAALAPLAQPRTF